MDDPIDAAEALSVALEAHLREENRYDSTEGLALRRQVLLDLTDLVRRWVSDTYLPRLRDSFPSRPTATAHIFTYGSYRLGVHTPEADIDTLAVFPSFVERRDFFNSFVKVLERHREVEDLVSVARIFQHSQLIRRMGLLAEPPTAIHVAQWYREANPRSSLSPSLTLWEGLCPQAKMALFLQEEERVDGKERGGGVEGVSLGGEKRGRDEVEEREGGYVGGTDAKRLPASSHSTCTASGHTVHLSVGESGATVAVPEEALCCSRRCLVTYLKYRRVYMLSSTQGATLSAEDRLVEQSSGYLSARPMLSALRGMKDGIKADRGRDGRKMRYIIFINSWLLPTGGDSGDGENTTLEHCCDACIARMVGVKVGFVHSLREALEASEEETSQDDSWVGGSTTQLESSSTAAGGGSSTAAASVADVDIRRDVDEEESDLSSSEDEHVSAPEPPVYETVTDGGTGSTSVRERDRDSRRDALDALKACHGGEMGRVPVSAKREFIMGWFLDKKQGTLQMPRHHIMTVMQCTAQDVDLAQTMYLDKATPRVAPPGTKRAGAILKKAYATYKNRYSNNPTGPLAVKTKRALLADLCIDVKTGKLAMELGHVKRLFDCSGKFVMGVQRECVARVAQSCTQGDDGEGEGDGESDGSRVAGSDIGSLQVASAHEKHAAEVPPVSEKERQVEGGRAAGSDVEIGVREGEVGLPESAHEGEDISAALESLTAQYGGDMVNVPSRAKVQFITEWFLDQQLGTLLTYKRRVADIMQCCGGVVDTARMRYMAKMGPAHAPPGTLRAGANLADTYAASKLKHRQNPLAIDAVTEKRGLIRELCFNAETGELALDPWHVRHVFECSMGLVSMVIQECAAMVAKGGRLVASGMEEKSGDTGGVIAPPGTLHEGQDISTAYHAYVGKVPTDQGAEALALKRRLICEWCLDQRTGRLLLPIEQVRKAFKCSRKTVSTTERTAMANVAECGWVLRPKEEREMITEVSDMPSTSAVTAGPSTTRQGDVSMTHTNSTTGSGTDGNPSVPVGKESATPTVAPFGSVHEGEDMSAAYSVFMNRYQGVSHGDKTLIAAKRALIAEWCMDKDTGMRLMTCAQIREVFKCGKLLVVSAEQAAIASKRGTVEPEGESGDTSMAGAAPVESKEEPDGKGGEREREESEDRQEGERERDEREVGDAAVYPRDSVLSLYPGDSLALVATWDGIQRRVREAERERDRVYLEREVDRLYLEFIQDWFMDQETGEQLLETRSIAAFMGVSEGVVTEALAAPWDEEEGYSTASVTGHLEDGTITRLPEVVSVPIPPSGYMVGPHGTLHEGESMEGVMSGYHQTYPSGAGKDAVAAKRQLIQEWCCDKETGRLCLGVQKVRKAFVCSRKMVHAAEREAVEAIERGREMEAEGDRESIQGGGEIPQDSDATHQTESPSCTQILSDSALQSERSAVLPFEYGLPNTRREGEDFFAAYANLLDTAGGDIESVDTDAKCTFIKEWFIHKETGYVRLQMKAVKGLMQCNNYTIAQCRREVIFEAGYPAPGETIREGEDITAAYTAFLAQYPETTHPTTAALAEKRRLIREYTINQRTGRLAMAPQTVMLIFQCTKRTVLGVVASTSLSTSVSGSTKPGDDRVDGGSREGGCSDAHVDHRFASGYEGERDPEEGYCDEGDVLTHAPPGTMHQGEDMREAFTAYALRYPCTDTPAATLAMRGLIREWFIDQDTGRLALPADDEQWAFICGGETARSVEREAMQCLRATGSIFPC
ncbi:poly(A) polymerase [Kipferlia bialata]|uniref:Poly(A) polymerase n=1 Tax=Kipferlia bialata TaxID=797122 RepID=A0A9K3GDU3_9EUKA|nr:poly(A) polymerase [Kipferlia bialata]|eukprot:g931.t1